jgi:hypothetical protein
LVAHGEFGTSGDLIEFVLGDFIPEIPEWAIYSHDVASVITLRRPDDIRLSEARDIRLGLLMRLRSHLRVVQAFDTDLALAVAYASQFPSEKSRKVLDEVAIERGSVSSELRA